MAIHWTVPHYQLSPSLAVRVPGGGTIWLMGRGVLGGLFLISGAEKLMALDGFAAALTKGGIPETISPWLAPLAAGIETLGGLCIMLGLATTWVCLMMIAFTIIAAFVSHRFWEAPPEMYETQMNHFLKNIMIVCGFLMLYVAGGGPYSIDRWRRYRR